MGKLFYFIILVDTKSMTISTVKLEKVWHNTEVPFFNLFNVHIFRLQYEMYHAVEYKFYRFSIYTNTYFRGNLKHFDGFNPAENPGTYDFILNSFDVRYNSKKYPKNIIFNTAIMHIQERCYRIYAVTINLVQCL